jgi:O-antigen/teichoic acid export membrane protein
MLPAEIGKIAIVTATVSFFSLLFLNPVGMFMNRRIHEWNAKGRISSYSIYFRRYVLAVSILAGLLMLGLFWANIWDSNIDINWLILIVCGNLIFTTLNQVVVSNLNMFGFRRLFIILSLATTLISLLAAILFMEIFSPSAEYWLTGLLIGQIIIGIIGKKIFFYKLNILGLKGKSPIKITYSQVNLLTLFAWPLAISVLLSWIQSQGYRYLMKDELGLTELGLFVAGYGISSGLISGFESIFSSYFQPKFYKLVSNNDLMEQDAVWIGYVQAILPSLLLTGIFIVALAPELTRIIIGENFLTSSQFVIWGAVAEVNRVATSTFAMSAHAKMNTKILIIPNLVCAVLALMLLNALTQLYGSAGVGIVLFLSALITTLLTALTTIRLRTLKIFSLRYFVISLVLGLCLLIVSNYFFIGIENYNFYEIALIKMFFISILFILFQYILLFKFIKNETPIIL